MKKGFKVLSIYVAICAVLSVWSCGPGAGTGSATSTGSSGTGTGTTTSSAIPDVTITEDTEYLADTINPSNFTFTGSLSGSVAASVDTCNIIYVGTGFSQTINSPLSIIQNRLIGQIQISQNDAYNAKMRVHFKDGSTYDYNLTSQIFGRNMPNIQITSHPLYSLTISNVIRLIGKCNRIDKLAKLAMSVNENVFVNKPFAAVWTNNSETLSEGLNIIRFRTISSNNETNRKSAIYVYADFTRPMVLSNIPANGVNNFSLTNRVRIYFTEPIRSSNIHQLVKLTKNGNPIAAAYVYTSNQNLLMITPVSPLQDGSTYAIVVSNAVQDIAGNTFLSNHTSVFSTIMPLMSSSVAMAGTSEIAISAPANGTVGLRAKSPRLLWSINSSSASVYKYYVLLLNAQPVIQNKQIVNKTSVIKYWCSDSASGAVGNIDLYHDTYDMVNGNPSTTQNVLLQPSTIYYCLIYGVDSSYRVTHSSQVLVFGW